MVVSKAKIPELERQVKAAASGRDPKLHRLLSQAGYVHPVKVTAAQLSRLWVVSEAAINKWWKEMGCPRNAKTKLFDLVDVIAWREDQLKADDVETAGGESPGLERYRIAKAALAELELKQKQGILVNMPRVKEEMYSLTQILRTAGELLGREYGVGPQKILEDAIRSWAAEVRRKYGPPGDGGGERGKADE